MTRSKFLPDGRKRLLSDPAVQAELARVRAEIVDRYRPLLAEASFFGRFRLRRRMRAEIRREEDRRVPSDALYLTS